MVGVVLVLVLVLVLVVGSEGRATEGELAGGAYDMGGCMLPFPQHSDRPPQTQGRYPFAA